MPFLWLCTRSIALKQFPVLIFLMTNVSNATPHHEQKLLSTSLGTRQWSTNLFYMDNHLQKFLLVLFWNIESISPYWNHPNFISNKCILGPKPKPNQVLQNFATFVHLEKQTKTTVQLCHSFPARYISFTHTSLKLVSSRNDIRSLLQPSLTLPANDLH